MTNLEINRRIAILKGWTNINELGGSLIGTPPAHLPDSRGQRLVPDWTGDKAACFDLLVDNVYGSATLNHVVFAKGFMSRIVDNWLVQFGEET